MADGFTDLHFETYNEEREIFGCNRCSLMMSIIDDRLSSFFSELTNKITQVEVRLEGLDVLVSNFEEMKGAGGKKRREGVFSASPKAAMSQRRVVYAYTKERVETLAVRFV